MHRRYLVPYDFDASAFDAMRSACLAQAELWARNARVRFVFVGRETPTPHAEDWLFRDENSGATLHLVSDLALQPTGAAVCYAVVDGTVDEVAAVRADLVQACGFLDDASISSLADTGMDTNPTLLLLMALATADGTPSAHAGAAAVLDKALSHLDALVRYVAVFAILQAGWAAYGARLHVLAATDADVNVRILAGEVCARLDV